MFYFVLETYAFHVKFDECFMSRLCLYCTDSIFILKSALLCCLGFRSVYFPSVVHLLFDRLVKWMEYSVW